LNSKVSLSFAASQNLRYVGSVTTNQPLTDSKTWSTTEGIHYQYSPRLNVGVTLGFSYDKLTLGSDMSAEQLQARFDWRPGNKLSLQFHGGFEDRQFLDSDASDAVNPILGFSLIYKIFEVTTIAVNVDRTVSASYFQNQITKALVFTASFHQRLLGRLNLDITGGLASSSYRSTTTQLSVDRNDDRSTVNIRIGCPVLHHGHVSLFYDWSDNSSNENGFGYTSNQVGLELGYRF
jgi:hypothetical protein